VIARYWMALAGIGRQDLSAPRRALGLAFSAASLPFEFTPLLVAAIDKAREARRIAAFDAALADAGGAFASTRPDPVCPAEPS
jgi:hypothetical protein